MAGFACCSCCCCREGCGGRCVGGRPLRCCTFTAAHRRYNSRRPAGPGWAEPQQVHQLPEVCFFLRGLVVLSCTALRRLLCIAGFPLDSAQRQHCWDGWWMAINSTTRNATPPPYLVRLGGTGRGRAGGASSPIPRSPNPPNPSGPTPAAFFCRGRGRGRSIFFVIDRHVYLTPVGAGLLAVGGRNTTGTRSSWRK